jgi:hypothetical protein
MLRTSTLAGAIFVAVAMATGSLPAGLIGLTVVSTSAEAQECTRPTKKMKNPAAECLRLAGAPYKRSPRSGNCAFWATSCAMADKCNAKWRPPGC